MKELNNGKLEFVYKYDIESLFKYFGVLDATNFARKIGINPSLLRQYKSGITLAGPKQKQRIEKGLHDLGRELLNIRL
jgi:DNA-binding transcriptional regulator YdaS (Cro superfamily)